MTDVEYDKVKQEWLPKRGSALFYIQGEKNIFGLGSAAPARFSFFPNKQAIREIFSLFTEFPEEANVLDQDNYPNNPELYAKPVIKQDKVGELITYLESQLQNTPPSNANIIVRKIYFNVPGSQTIDSAKLEFRIEYKPFIETNIRSYLPYNDNNTEIISEQFFNQQENVVSIQALEELHQRVVNRGRGSTEIITLLDRSLDNVPEPGVKVDNFVLSSVFHSINRTNITSDYSLSEHFAKLNKFVAVLEEYRQFSIPNENLVKRQYSKEAFGKFQTSPGSPTVFLDLLDYIGNKKVGAIQFIVNDQFQTLPVVFTPFNNQLRLETEFATNAKTGDKSVETEDTEIRRNEPIIYTQEGFLPSISVRFIEGLAENPNDWTQQESFDLPLTTRSLPSVLYTGFEFVEKDPREILRYVFSMHHIDSTGSGRVGNAWSKELGIVGSGLNNPTNKLVFLNTPRQNKNFIDPSTIAQSFQLGGSIQFSVASGNVLLPRATYTNLDEVKS